MMKPLEEQMSMYEIIRRWFDMYESIRSLDVSSLEYAIARDR